MSLGSSVPSSFAKLSIVRQDVVPTQTTRPPAFFVSVTIFAVSSGTMQYSECISCSEMSSAFTGRSIVPPSMYGERGDGTRTRNQRITVGLDASRRGSLGALAATPGIRALTPDLTWFQLFATALFAFIHRTSGQPSITIGAPVHNRSTMTFRRTPGLFMEVYPMGVTVATLGPASHGVAHATVRLDETARVREMLPVLANRRLEIDVRVAAVLA